jgi:hypothetical protein
MFAKQALWWELDPTERRRGVLARGGRQQPDCLSSNMCRRDMVQCPPEAGDNQASSCSLKTCVLAAVPGICVRHVRTQTHTGEKPRRREFPGDAKRLWRGRLWPGEQPGETGPHEAGTFESETIRNDGWKQKTMRRGTVPGPASTRPQGGPTGRRTPPGARAPVGVRQWGGTRAPAPPPNAQGDGPWPSLPGAHRGPVPLRAGGNPPSPAPTAPRRRARSWPQGPGPEPG